jgi:alpha-galactosidase
MKSFLTVSLLLAALGSPAAETVPLTSRPGDGPREEAVLLTPKPGPAPRINGPRVLGCRPGNPFLFRIPTTGQRPISFSVENLSASLKLDPATGIITGINPERGEYRISVRARNPHGEAARTIKIVSGDTLALTPPMGWNHWYTHYDRITDPLLREAADVMVSSGMADVGYQYVSIDDCWMNAPKNKDPLRVGPLRDDQGNILPNKHFPDMKAMTDYIHAKGLRAGIYTSPGPFTCAGFAASYQHEAQDAKQFADWGFDFLKYDWCSYSGIAKRETGSELEKLKQPYQQMGDLLKQQKRDILLNLCQYGMGQVWEWGAEVGGHCWRTAGDLGFELDRIFPVALKNAEHRAFSRPGAWNDPDYIQIGYIGSARGMGEPKPCPLTPSEQYAFMSLWCLSAAPLFYSGHMGKLDEFTINVLCNPEVIDVDQDPLGQCGRVVPLAEETFLMVKDLEDGSKAVGLFNRGEVETRVTAKWSDVGVRGKQTVRDLWRQKDLGPFENEFRAAVPRHGGVMVRLGGAK